MDGVTGLDSAHALASLDRSDSRDIAAASHGRARPFSPHRPLRSPRPLLPPSRCASPARAAFTLIELLIVVAIVSILAAIAVPNFLEAQIRAKVARVQSELRLLANGLEAYAVDNDVYPPGIITDPAFAVDTWRVTTPIAYISAVPRDIFAPRPGDSEAGGPFGLNGIYLHYLNDPLVLDEYWLLFSYGPDGDMEQPDAIIYDPSNGTLSSGDIYLSTAKNRWPDPPKE